MTASPAIGAALSAGMQSAVDSIGAIDTQVAAALSVSIDPSVLPQLAADMTALTVTLTQWTTSGRGEFVAALRGAIVENSSLPHPWPVDRQDQTAMLAFAATLQQAIAQAQVKLQGLPAALVPFDVGLTQATGALATDAVALNNQISDDQANVDSLQDQVDDTEQELADAQANPISVWIQGGMSAAGLLEQVTELLASLKTAQVETDEANALLAKLSQLTAASGALSGLSSGLTGLNVSLSDVDTAVLQISNALGDLQREKPLPPILSAQLDTMVSDLEQADAVIREVLAGS